MKDRCSGSGGALATVAAVTAEEEVAAMTVVKWDRQDQP
jgi:hypothetical protein